MAQAGVSDLNAIFNLMKNADWGVKMCDKLYHWIRSWFDQEMKDPKRELSLKLLNLDEHLKNLDRHFDMDCPDFECKVQDALQYLREVHALTLKTGDHHLTRLCEGLLRTFGHDSSARQEPVVVLLTGEPGQGKSVCATILAQMISKTLAGKQSVYSLPPDYKYMDGYRGQPVVVLDDLGQNPDGNDMACFCQMVSTTQWVTPQASLSDKGRVFTSPVIIATSNLSQFRPPTIADPEAVERRFTFKYQVEAVVRTARGKLDMAKAMEQNPSVWTPDCVDANVNLFSRQCLRFKDLRTPLITLSLVEVYEKVIAELKSRKVVSNSLGSIVAQYRNIDDDQILGMVTRITGLRKEALGKRVAGEDVAAVVQQTCREMQHLTLAQLCWAMTGHDGEPPYWYHCFCEIMKWTIPFIAFLMDLLMIFTIIRLIIKGVQFLYGLLVKQEEIDEADGQGVYDGSRRQKKRVLKVRQQQVVPKPAPRMKTRLVEVEPDGIVEAVTQGGPRAAADFEKSILERNCFPITFRSAGNPLFSLTALAIGGRHYLANRHALENQNWDEVDLGGETFGWEEILVTGFRDDQWDVLNDCYLVTVPRGPERRNIVRHFVCSEPTRRCNAVGLSNSMQFPRMMWATQVHRTLSRIQTESGTFPSVAVYSTPTRNGFCGSPIVMESQDGKKIVGIHSAGDGVNGYATVITQAMLMKAVPELFSVPQGLITREEPGPVVNVNRKTSLRKSPAWYRFKPEAGPAVLSKFDQRLDPDVDFEEALFQKHTVNQETLPKEFYSAARDYAYQLFQRIGRDNGVVSMEEALNGDGITDAMDMDTSVGYPHVLDGKRRKDFISRDENGKLQPSEILIEEVQEFANGKKPVFVTFLKDEIRKMEKIRRGATRIVDASPLGYAVFGRCVLMKFMSAMMKNNGTKTGSAVGCNPDVDWTRYAFELNDQYVFDLDFKNFDSTHSTAMFQLLKDVFFTEDNGFDQDLVGVFLDGISVSQHAYGDQRYRLRGGLPSGCPATSILNTVINNIIIRAAIRGAYSVDSVEWDSFRMVAYGDDVVYASEQRILPGLLAEWLHQHTTYQVTPANKSTSFPVDSTLWDVTFLKRHFTPDREYPYLIAPRMDLDNLKQIISFFRPGTFPEKVQSLARLALHCDEADYNELLGWIPETCPSVEVPCYSRLREEWLASFW